MGNKNSANKFTEEYSNITEGIDGPRACNDSKFRMLPKKSRGRTRSAESYSLTTSVPHEVNSSGNNKPSRIPVGSLPVSRDATIAEKVTQQPRVARKTAELGQKQHRDTGTGPNTGNCRPAVESSQTFPRKCSQPITIQKPNVKLDTDVCQAKVPKRTEEAEQLTISKTKGTEQLAKANVSNVIGNFLGIKAQPSSPRKAKQDLREARLEPQPNVHRHRSSGKPNLVVPVPVTDPPSPSSKQYARHRYYSSHLEKSKPRKLDEQKPGIKKGKPEEQATKAPQASPKCVQTEKSPKTKPKQQTKQPGKEKQSLMSQIVNYITELKAEKREDTERGSHTVVCVDCRESGQTMVHLDNSTMQYAGQLLRHFSQISQVKSIDDFITNFPQHVPDCKNIIDVQNRSATAVKPSSSEQTSRNQKSLSASGNLTSNIKELKKDILAKFNDMMTHKSVSDKTVIKGTEVIEKRVNKTNQTYKTVTKLPDIKPKYHGRAQPERLYVGSEKWEHEFMDANETGFGLPPIIYDYIDQGTKGRRSPVGQKDHSRRHKRVSDPMPGAEGADWDPGRKDSHPPAAATGDSKERRKAKIQGAVDRLYRNTQEFQNK